MKLPNLPATSDEYWEGAKTHSQAPTQIPLCETHDYVMHGDGTATCTKCPYGVKLPGYMKVKEGKIVDLRHKAGG